VPGCRQEDVWQPTDPAVSHREASWVMEAVLRQPLLLRVHWRYRLRPAPWHQPVQSLGSRESGVVVGDVMVRTTTDTACGGGVTAAVRGSSFTSPVTRAVCPSHADSTPQAAVTLVALQRPAHTRTPTGTSTEWTLRELPLYTGTISPAET